MTPFIQYGNNGQLIHFAHANGFPPAVYRAFFEQLSCDYQVIAMEQRPLWKASIPPKHFNWKTLGEDLIHFLDSQGLKQIIGMGHSMGGVATIYAAAKRPDLFKQLVLIDPVIFANPLFSYGQYLPTSWKMKYHPMYGPAMRRRDRWTSQQEAFDAYRNKKVFKHCSDEVLWDYVNALIVPMEESEDFKLRYAKEWEALIYDTVPYVIPQLREIACPILGIRAKYTNALSIKATRKWQRVHNKTTIIEKDTGHLIPLEIPAVLAENIATTLI